MMNHIKWSKAEKEVARRAFDSAYERECGAIRAKLQEMTASASQPADIWEIHDYLSDRRRAVDGKYDYRYSVLIMVFSRLIEEGWLTEPDLLGLGADKIEKTGQIVSWR